MLALETLVPHAHRSYLAVYGFSPGKIVDGTNLGGIGIGIGNSVPNLLDQGDAGTNVRLGVFELILLNAAGAEALRAPAPD